MQIPYDVHVGRNVAYNSCAVETDTHQGRCEEDAAQSDATIAHESVGLCSIQHSGDSDSDPTQDTVLIQSNNAYGIVLNESRNIEYENILEDI